MVYFINYVYSIGEPAQALPGFKGEIVSLKENHFFKLFIMKSYFFIS
jgi:hypothetical protein